MPARTLNDFFAGFFYGHTKEDTEVVAMTIIAQTNRRKNDRRRSHRRMGNIEVMEIIREEDKGREVTVRNETFPQREEKSTLTWFEEFAVEWSEIFVPKKQKRNLQGGQVL